MKKVLIIGHFWPYRGGSKRVIGLAKYFPEFGWEPIILTGPLNRKPDFKVRYIEAQYRNIFGFKSKIDFSDQMSHKIKDTPPFFKKLFRSLFKYVAEIIAYPDEYKYWKYPAIKSVKDILKEEKIDAIISVWPVTAHLIAKNIKDKYKIPWIADFPDLWSQNNDYSYSFLRKFFDRQLEVKTISLANAIITISERAVEVLKKIHKQKIIYAVPHGFDAEKTNIPPVNLTEKFTITYTGRVYPKKQDPLKILISLKELIEEGIINPKDVEVRFYGPQIYEFKKELKKLGLIDIVKQYGIVPLEVSIRKQRESQLLLLLNWEDPNINYAFFGKTAEYLAARRPILSTGGFGSDVIEDLLKITKAGVYAAGIDDIKKYLREFYLEYKQKGKIDYKGNIEKINKYSHREMTRKFAVILNELL